MKRNVVIMDFSGIYQNEQFYEGEQISWIDLSDISGTNCYCDGDAQAQILERMEISGFWNLFYGFRKLSLYEQNRERAGERALQPAGI